MNLQHALAGTSVQNDLVAKTRSGTWSVAYQDVGSPHQIKFGSLSVFANRDTQHGRRATQISFTIAETRAGLVSVGSTASISNNTIAFLLEGPSSAPPNFELDEVARAMTVRLADQQDIVFRSLATAPQIAPATMASSPKAHIKWLMRVLDNWGMTRGQSQTLLGLASEADVAAIFDGRKDAISRDLIDRIRLILEIDTTLGSVLHDDKEEQEWLKRSNEMLEGAVPLYLMLDGSMRSLILVKELLDRASGR